MRRIAIAVVGTIGATLLGANVAGGAVGDLEEPATACISGETGLSLRCAVIPGATAGGFNSGLDAVESTTVSRDGKWVYAAARGDDAIARFKRRRTTGALAYRGCVSGDANSACRKIRSAVSGGLGSGLDNVRSLILSRDGESAYGIAADDDAVARFDRTRRGKLVYRGCIGGNSGASCKETPGASPAGEDSGLDHPSRRRSAQTAGPSTSPQPTTRPLPASRATLVAGGSGTGAASPASPRAVLAARAHADPFRTRTSTGTTRGSTTPAASP